MVRVAAEAGADWVGFVLYGKSPRNVLGRGADALEQAGELSRFAQELGLLSVLLMVDPEDDLVQRVLEEVSPDALQLHGRETPKRVERLWRPRADSESVACL